MLAVSDIDWWALGQMPGVRTVEAAAFDAPRAARIYLSTPITAYLRRDELALAVHLAADWQGWLLSEGYSPLCPALLTLPPLTARGDDHVGQMLQAMRHDWWMQRCLPWMEACEWLAVPPVPGWRESEGCWQEARTFAAWNRPVRLLTGRA